jgi:sodium transport system permease protein
MNWRNVKLIWRRELRDQLRDRRTLFMVAVLPMLMYPLLGMSVFQLSQFMQTHEGRVAVIGAGDIFDAAGGVPIIAGDRFAEPLFDSPADRSRLGVTSIESRPDYDLASALDEHQAKLEAGAWDVVVFFPPTFASRLVELRTELAKPRGEARAPRAPPEIPQPVVLYNSGREASQVAFLRVERVLSRWRQAVVSQNLAESELPSAVTTPFEMLQRDIASADVRSGALWSKLLPFVLFVWALTGAFYPAVDLCAGEKERGTLETLLASPAERNEIVLGKLLTVMCFSIFTACLNLASMGLTGKFVMQQFAAMSPVDGGLGNLGFPPFTAILWLLVALVPMAALFSALSLACASFAKSTKEGQYYFMPLFLCTMPLMLMPMSPGVELNLGTSLVPIMGVVLLLRALIEGNLATAAPYFLPTSIVTLICCWLAAKWAVAQFNSESVLFRESEQFNLKLWLRRLIRDREATPTPKLAIALAATLLIVKFFGEMAVSRFAVSEPSLSFLLTTTVIGQLGFILVPTLLFAWCFTCDQLRTFLLRGSVPWRQVGLAGLLAVAIHPVGIELTESIRWLYPISQGMKEGLNPFAKLMVGAPWPLLLATFALMPAVVEELTFRGFILSGLRKLPSLSAAVGISAVAFGVIHGVLQQSLSAAILGVLLGIIALRTNHLAPSVLFHATYNSLNLLYSQLAGKASADVRNALFGDFETKISLEHLSYRPVIVILGGGLALLLLGALARSTRVATPPAAVASAPPQAL